MIVSGGQQMDSAVHQGIPGGSAGKESACDAGDPGSIPGEAEFPEMGHYCTILSL